MLYRPYSPCSSSLQTPVIDRLWIREFVERQSCRTTRVHILSVQAVQKRPNRNMVNRFRARIAGLSIILHPFGIFLRNSILKFLGAYGIFYFRLLCMYEAVWVCHIVLFGCFKSLYNCFGLGEYIGRSLFHYITNYPPMEAFVTVGIYYILGHPGITVDCKSL